MSSVRYFNSNRERTSTSVCVKSRLHEVRSDISSTFGYAVCSFMSLYYQLDECYNDYFRVTLIVFDLILNVS